MSRIERAYTHTHTQRVSGEGGSGVRRKAARCEPDEPRTNRATNQWWRWAIVTFANTTCLPHRNRRTQISWPARGEIPIHLSSFTLDRSYCVAFSLACNNDLAVLVCCTVLIERDERYTPHAYAKIRDAKRSNSLVLRTSLDQEANVRLKRRMKKL